MNTPQTLDYGEPWKLHDYNTPIGETGDYEGLEEILTRDNVLAAVSWNPDDEDQERFQRIIQCVNDCAGMADPAAEIAAMREVIKAAKHIHHWHDREPDGMVVSKSAVFALWEALEKLQPFTTPGA